MKIIRIVLMMVFMSSYGLPIPIMAQHPDEFSLPGALAGGPYSVNVVAVLRETYHLKLETDSRISIFRWAFAGGKMPPGLIIRRNGTIFGTPHVPRTEPYRFKLKVDNPTLLNGDALTVDFTLAISTPRIRLAGISLPKLVPTDGSDSSDIAQPQSTDGMGQQTQNSTRRSFTMRDGSALARIPASTFSAASDRGSSPDMIYASMLKDNTDIPLSPIPLPQNAGGCDPNHVPLPWPTGKVFTIDARTGNTRGGTQFEKGDKVSVIIDNENPYLYKYAFTKDIKIIEETAPASFFPLFGGLDADFTSGTSAKEADKASKAGPNSLRNTPFPFLDRNVRTLRNTTANCQGYMTSYEELRRQVADALSWSLDIGKNDLDSLAKDNKARSGKYDAILLVIHNAQSTSGELYCNSQQLLAVPDPGALPSEIEATQKKVARLKTEADHIKVAVDVLRENYPDCADMAILNLISHAADGLLGDASKYETDLKKIKTALEKMDDLKKLVAKTVNDSRSFRQIIEFGPFSHTIELSLGLKRTPPPSADDKEAKAEDLVKPDDTKLTFGHAPFFSISGGLAFSPLRKFEFQRVQGFERDRQGNEVLVNGKPNFTSVIGLKESSHGRITPLLLLNGRITNFEKTHLGVDNIHLSLGITAKNDNKGTDIEYLFGPSFSLLEENMFLTVGGYGGRQQSLEGNLFTGAAVPSDLSELPIRKNYRWNFGFALSYRIPVNKK